MFKRFLLKWLLESGDKEKKKETPPEPKPTPEIVIEPQIKIDESGKIRIVRVPVNKAPAKVN